MSLRPTPSSTLSSLRAVPCSLAGALGAAALALLTAGQAAADDTGQTYAEALETSRRLFGRGLSVQTYHLFPKIREVQGREGLLEIHPELAFLVMNQRRPLPAKKTAEGRDLRRRLLGWAVVPKLTGTQPDDVLDAAAVAWSAWRHAKGEAVALGEPPALIWY